MKTFYLLLFFSLSYIGSLAQNNDYQKKIDSLQHNIKQHKENYTQKIKDLKQLIVLHEQNNDYDSIFIVLDELEGLAEDKKDSIVLADVYFKRGEYSIYDSKTKDVKKLFSKSILLYKKNNQNNTYYKELFYNYLNLSDLFINTNQYGKALSELYKAKEYLPKTPNNRDDKLLENYYLNNLAYIYTKTENYIKAITILKQALSLEKEIKDDYSKSDIYNSFATIYSKQNENEKAIEYYNLAEKIYLKINSNRGLVSIINNRAVSYFDLKQYDKAQEEFEKAIELAKKADFKAVFSESYHYLGKIHVLKGNTQTALNYFNNSINTSKEIEYNDFIINSLYQKALILKSKNDKSGAISFLKESLQYQLEPENSAPLKKVYKELFMLYQGLDYQKSITYFEKYTKLSDSINNIAKINQTEILKAEFNHLKYKSDLEQKENELLITKEREESSKVKFTLLVILGSIVIASLIIAMFRQRKLSKTRKKMWATSKDLMAAKQENLDKEIEYKNKQITDFAIHISEKNELLEHIKQKIKKLPIVNKTTTSQINDVIVFINDDINQNKEKVQLYSEVDDSTKTFNQNLARLYPDLNDKEKRIATLVRLNQTSKQISLQLNITSASVDNYRSILRKKMNVPKGASIVKFIKNI